MAFKAAKRGDVAIVERTHSATYINGRTETWVDYHAGRVTRTEKGWAVEVRDRDDVVIPFTPRHDRVHCGRLTIPAAQALTLIPVHPESVKSAVAVLAPFRRAEGV